MSSHQFFSSDVKGYYINDYLLVHHARKFDLNVIIIIRLKSTYTPDDYILEFSLPCTMTGNIKQQFMLNNLSNGMQKICMSLRRVSSKAELLKQGGPLLRIGFERDHLQTHQ